MGLFGGSSSSSSTSHTTSWLADQIEPIVSSFISGYTGINYTDSTVAGITAAERSALDRAEGGGAINAGNAIAGAGANIIDQVLGEMSGLLEGNGKTQFMSGVTGIYNKAGDFMDAQNSAIQDSVYSQMGQQFGQSAQSNMASTSVSGSSAAQSATNSILASGANSMVQQESDLAMQILKGSVGLTTDAMGSEVSMLNTLLKEGGNIFGAGTKMSAAGEKNQMNAGLFDQWFNQQVANNNRKNEMMNDNIGLLDFSLLMQEVLPTANIDTTTKTNSTMSSGSSGMQGLTGAATTAAAIYMMM
ncbi:hypothetical protein FMJ22_13360 [Klebsiella michiganensis]|uniref:hypothetical protein n=1 Tax=Klebsiella michiganensis TaxID=1134687 RepID=UPI001CCD8FCF|nr:hypothetical protein [Klebsiella michiganensis]MBZ7392383.1 hypothetical protein [Klebsiella michiganensis]